MKRGQTSIRNGIQDILFPHENMNITQGNDGSFSHQGANALDLAEIDTGRSPMFAPFDVICKAVDVPKNGNAVFWESQKKVRFADGTIDYATIMILHDNDMTGIFVGAKYPQGHQIAEEGTAGFAIGNHNHFEIAKGKYTHMYDKNKQGIYHLPKSISADQACFVDGTNIINGNRMKWKKLADVPIEMGEVLNGIPKDFIKENGTFIAQKDKIRIRKAPSTKGVNTGLYYDAGMSVKYDGYVKRSGYVWISWISATTKERRWMATGELNSKGVNDKPWGTFK